MTNCSCDELIFPPPLSVPAGLSALPLQLATFPKFREAMLHAIASEPALADLRARSGDDYALLLLDMWAYVCDFIAFYREVIGNEQYVRTAQLRPSLRRLIGLLGYVPRPASAATADIAVLADGRQPVLVPAGTQFRSGAFPGGAPQVFETGADATVHPLLNKWTLQRNRPATVDAGEGYPTLGLHYIWADRKHTTVKAGAVALVQHANGTVAGAVSIDSVADFPAQDGVTYKQIQWSPPLIMAGSTPLSDVRLSVPTRKATLWKLPIVFSGDVVGNTTVTLDGIYRGILKGMLIVIAKGSDLRWFIIQFVSEEMRTLPGGGTTTVSTNTTTGTGSNAVPSTSSATVTAPPPQAATTILTLDVGVNDPSRRHINYWWTDVDRDAIVVHYGFVPAAAATMPFFTTLRSGDPLTIATPIEPPADGSVATRFLLEDKNGLGSEVSGGLDFTSGAVTPDQGSAIGSTLTMPVQLYGNVVTVSRGESVPSEVLGSGDATIANQSFKLKKKPLTYQPSPTAGNESGVVSSLKVYVDGLQWTEVQSFYGVGPADQVYIVRQNDDDESTVTFANPLSTGAVVAASYRFGAGALAPPAGSIHQLGKPFKGLKGARNPVAASGGSDREPPAALRTSAPQSALLLGRAVSIQDMEAAAARVPGVRAAHAEWSWNKARQRPVVQIWYIGAAGVAQTVLQTLHGLTDPTVPIHVEPARPQEADLAISLETDPRRLADDVAAETLAALLDPASGLLAPERIGISAALFRSQIFAAVLAVPGAVAVTGLLWNGAPFDPYGIAADPGTYFDFGGDGVLSVNGLTPGGKVATNV